MNRGTVMFDDIGCTPLAAQPKAGKNDDFSPIDCLFRRFQTASRLAMDVCRCRSCRRRRRPAPPSAARTVRAGAYDGTWNVMFATQAGNCSSTNSVPFTVSGTPGFVGRRRQGHRRHQPRRQRCRQDIGRRCRRPAAAAGSPAIRAPAAGAGSFPATAAAAPGRRRGASCRLTSPKQANDPKQRPARSSDGPYSSSMQFANANGCTNQRGARTITT